ncbi:polysaccharide deacetylase family protein [Chryseosolibacter indicus]|uniref:Polysaccharide deacetylase family protein n=1 Tax=Chryseosolibacter indicus TaxID=2782351 RepID=A0ABS5VXC7_9BACT|nr:polysaccharide deacetylase family protein [Chryseosolibacter indicus]MBT1705502.1 polysaccharide deacetylase family protein [Chryseosolibacter indicus]
MIPYRTPFFLPYLYPSLTWRKDDGSKSIYLTFDDGPVAGPTEFVLETLSQFSAKATFFCIGDNVRKHPEVFNKIIEGGHAIGNHTYNHLNGWKTQLNTYINNIQLCEQQISRGRNPGGKKLLRPPYGKIKRSQIKALSSYDIIMWDVLSKDYSHTHTPEKCLQESIGATRNGSIVVFHDSFKAETNLMYVLPRYIQHFKELGFEFKSL